MNRLLKLEIENFKSLVDFKINFDNFNCIIGLNGTGKSTLLQSLDFISQQMNGDINKWLHKRNWDRHDLSSKLTKTQNITISLEIEINNIVYIWSAVFSTTKMKCTIEHVHRKKDNFLIFKIVKSKYIIYKELDKHDKLMGEAKVLSGDIIQEYEGSILSSLKEEILSNELVAIKDFIKNITSLDLLSPQSLRQKSRSDGKELGLSGEHLTAFLNSLSESNQDKLLTQLQQCYRDLYDFDIIKSRNGWKRLEVTEFFNNIRIITEAKHVNDGLLRIITILAQLFTKKDFLLFDEIENGINPEIIEFLVDLLVASNHQVLITTHSPMILNYIEDDVAMKSIQYIYKTKDGHTKVIPFFNIPQMKKKLEVMGPGEVYVDTDLIKLYDIIKELEK